MSLRDWHRSLVDRKVRPEKPKAALLPPGMSVPSGSGVRPSPIQGVLSYQTDAIGASGAAQQSFHDQNVLPPEQQSYNPNALKALPWGAKPARGPRVRFYDPLSLIYATGFRDRRFSLTYDTLRRVSYQLSLLGAILLTRVNQVASFAQPFRENRQVGFQIRYKDETKIPTEDERKAIQRLEQFVMECGAGHNDHCPYERDDFETFLKKFTRDSLTYDQGCFEVVPDEYGRPYEFRAVDASTIRLAATYDGYRGEQPRRFQGRQFTERWRQRFGEDFMFEGEGVYAVQVLHGRIENIFTYNDMAFCVRNPRTDIWINGYGFAEAEMALNTVMRMLWAEEFNARNFRQGSMANGIINFKGENFDPQQLESFRRIWQAQVVGVENSHRIPVIQVPEGVEFVNMSMKNREMEYQQWLNYLMKILSGVFQIDPSEVNFDLVSGGGGGKSGPLFESKHEWKIKHSRDKGLRPLLKWIAKQISRYVIDPLDPSMYLDFVGLDQLSEQERIGLLTQKVTNYMTINEGRQSEGLPPVKGGDIINNPTYLQALQAEQAKEVQEDPFSPWGTEGEFPQPGYGEADPIPLYMQEEFEEPASGGAPEGGEQGPPPGGGFPGMQ